MNALSQNVRALVIDDDPPARDQFVRLLKEEFGEEVQITLAGTLPEGEERLSASEFNLVITDVDLGSGEAKFGGMHILSILLGKGIPVLVVSGLPEREAIDAKALEALSKRWAAFDYLGKPFDESHFKALVREAVTEREAAERERLEHVDPDITFDPESNGRAVLWKGKRVRLSLTKMEIVRVFLEHVGEDVDFDTFYKKIQSGKNIGNLRNHMSELRREFKEVDPTFDRIQIVAMIGYKWVI